jgi:Ser/Thr protein kinase RdoA (MazF antagonist)
MEQFAEIEKLYNLKAGDLELICREYDLGKFSGICEKLGGSFNVNLKIKTTKGTFVVRLLNRNITEERLRHIDRHLAMLNDAGLPVLLPLASPAGKTWCHVGNKLAQITPYVINVPFLLRSKQVFESGKMLRKFHNASEHAEPVSEPEYSFYPDSDYFSKAVGLLKTIPGIDSLPMAGIERLINRVDGEWKQALAYLPTSTIHGDWHFWNHCYTPDDEIRILMDFDFIQSGKRIHDIAYALWVIYVLLPEHAFSFDEAFLKGYGSLTVQEQQMLPTAIMRVSLFFLCHAAYSAYPEKKIQRALNKQKPFLDWIGADGKKRIWSLTR